jgi:hypothetical protein
MKYNITLILMINVISAFSQTDSSSKWKLYFDANYSNRFLLLKNSTQDLYNGHLTTSYSNSMEAFVDFNDHFKGAGLNLGIRLFNKKGLGIKYSNTFRYDHVYFTKIPVDSNHMYASGINVQALITDYHISLVQLIGKGRIKHMVEVGFSRMNNGTNYPISQNAPDSNLLDQSFTGNKNLKYSAMNINYSFMIDNFNAGIGFYYKMSSDFAGNTEFLNINGVFELRLGYSFNLLKD